MIYDDEYAHKTGQPSEIKSVGRIMGSIPWRVHWKEGRSGSVQAMACRPAPVCDRPSHRTDTHRTRTAYRVVYRVLLTQRWSARVRVEWVPSPSNCRPTVTFRCRLPFFSALICRWRERDWESNPISASHTHKKKTGKARHSFSCNNTTPIVVALLRTTNGLLARQLPIK